MKVEKVKTRGYLFTFNKPYKTTLYVIKAPNHLFFCDTFLGPDPIRKVLEYLKEDSISIKNVNVFNSHHDYDHIWGNQVFKNEKIIAHELCKKKIEEIGEEDLKQFEDHRKGEIELTLPNTTFLDKLEFPEDNVLFFHSPGHTPDSSSCYDSIDKVLIVGDNIENPIPYLREPNLEEYISTLESYLKIEADIIISGHSDLMDNMELIETNLAYLKAFREKKVDIKKLGRRASITHFMNLKNLAEFYKKQNNNKIALDYYKNSLNLLENLPEDVQGKQKQLNIIKKTIKELS